MIDIIIGLVILTIISLAIYKIYREKRGGNKCIGCPYGKQCASNSCSSTIKKASH